MLLLVSCVLTPCGCLCAGRTAGDERVAGSSSFHDSGRISSNCGPHFLSILASFTTFSYSLHVKVNTMPLPVKNPLITKRTAGKDGHIIRPSCLIPQQSGIMIFPLTSNDCFLHPCASRVSCCMQRRRHDTTTGGCKLLSASEDICMPVIYMSAYCRVTSRVRG